MIQTIYILIISMFFSTSLFSGILVRDINYSSDNLNLPTLIGEYSEIDIDAESGVVLDIDSGIYIFEKNSNKKMPIASITKLMTALVFLDHNPGFDTEYTITSKDRRNGGRIYLYLGDKVKVRDLFNISLVGSANTATIALVNSTDLNEQEFVDAMNRKAIELGLFQTSFSDPVGLSDDNISTARNVARLANYALKKKEIAEAVAKSEYSFNPYNQSERIIYSTDALIGQSFYNINILGGKTGYTDLAGYSFVGKFSNGNANLISVILNSESRSGRFNETKKTINWAYNNHRWQ